MYMLTKLMIVACVKRNNEGETKARVEECCFAITTFMLTFIETGIIAYIHSKYFLNSQNMEHIYKLLWRETTQNHYNNISLGDLHECRGSIIMCSISTLVSEC